MYAQLSSLSLFGLHAEPIKIEVDLRGGLPAFNIIGLPGTMVRESKDRVLSAIRNSGFKVPLQKVIVNLAPADIKKQGTLFDLPIALGILMSSRQLDINIPENIIFAGELSLDGTLSSLNGALCISINAKEHNFKKMFIPEMNFAEASLIENIDIIGIKNLNEAVEFLTNPNKKKKLEKINLSDITIKKRKNNLDFSEVKGQLAVKRAVEIAVSGSHNILMIGPPGSGKSMIAKRIPTIMPNMTIDEMLETTKIYSVAGKLSSDFSLVTQRPFRNPHHTSSSVAIIGGGEIPKPGEITLSNNGVLFMDEFPYYKKNILQSLREPLEDKVVMISRSSGSVIYPANFMLVSAMNPCPCGYLTHPDIECKCSETQIKKYLSKLTGPLMDRIDIYINVPKIDYAKLLNKSVEESSETIRKRIGQTRQIQNERFKNSQTNSNANMTRGEIENFCELDSNCKNILSLASGRLRISGRGFDRILKISRTIADMDKSEKIEEKHILEAIQYRKSIT